MEEVAAEPVVARPRKIEVKVAIYIMTKAVEIYGYSREDQEFEIRSDL